jgi:hypothetical protein
MIRAEVQAGSWIGGNRSPDRVERLRAFSLVPPFRQESVMDRKRDAKNDFFYACVMFAMFAVVVFNVAAEFYAVFPEAYFVDFNEAHEPRVMAAKADARADVAMRVA